MLLLKDLHSLHWLRVGLPERITYKLCVLVHNSLHGTAPRYPQDVIQPVAVALAVVCGRHLYPRWYSSGYETNYDRRPIELSPSRDLEHETVFLSSSSTARLLAPSENISRPICFHCHFRSQNSTLLSTDSVKRPHIAFHRLRRYKIVSFALHYITYSKRLWLYRYITV